MKRICKQCGVEFEISNSEIEFYKKKNLSLPKRCKQCRNKNKRLNAPYITNNNNIQNQRGYYNPNTVRQKNTRKPVRKLLMCSLVAVFLLLCIASAFFKGVELIEFFEKNSAVTYTEPSQYQPTQSSSDKPSENKQYDDSSSNKPSENKQYDDSSSDKPSENKQYDDSSSDKPSENKQYNEKHYTFRKYEYLQEHYQKHGISMGFNSAQDYLDAANTVINNPSSLHKLEKEDGDDVYYLEQTNELVIVSTDGYVRTYFRPDDGIDYFNRQ